MKKKSLVIVLALVIILGSLTSVFAGVAFTDVSQRHWAAGDIKKAVEDGYIQGVGGGKFNPDGRLTRSQMAEILSKAFELEARADLSGFTDLEEGKWYYPAMGKVVEAGFFKGEGKKLMPNNEITREQAFATLARALDLDSKSELNGEFPDKDKLSSWAKKDGEVYALINLGFISGDEAGRLNPKSTITRAEMVKIMNASLEYLEIDKDLVGAAEKAIRALPEEIRLGSKDAVESARSLVDAALKREEDAKIEGLDRLEAAEEQLKSLQAEEIVDAISLAEKAIASLPEEIELESKEVVETARDLVDAALKLDKGARIEGLDKLLAAEEQLGGLLVHDDYDYILINNNTEVELTGYKGKEKELVLPSKIANKPVTSIGKEAFAEKSLTKLEISEGVITIRDSAFASNNLTSVTMPDSLVSIGKRAFAENSLRSLVIPNGVIAIGDSSFINNKLTTISISDRVASIGDWAFSGNLLTDLKIPDGVTSIGDSAFSNNTLRNIVISEGVTTIKEGTFENNNLTSLEIPDGVESIGDWAFSNNNLTSLEIPDGVIRIGYSSFSDNDLTSLEISDGVIFIEDWAFTNNNLTSITIPTLSIGDFAFSDNNLTSVNILDGVMNIGAFAFSENNLSSLEIPSSVEGIGQGIVMNNGIHYMDFIIFGEIGSAAQVYAYASGHMFIAI